MDLSDEILKRLFEHGDGDRQGGVVVVDLSDGLGTLFVSDGLHFVDGVPLIVCIRHDEGVTPPMREYLGELLMPVARMQRMAHEVFVPELVRDQFPRPPEYLGRSIPARQQPVRGSRLSCGGWR